MAGAGFDCAAGCAHCPAGEACEEREAGTGDPPLRNWSFAAASAGYFLVPLCLAVVGAAVGGSAPVGQFIGAAAGFAAGMVAAGAAAKLCQRSHEEAA